MSGSSLTASCSCGKVTLELSGHPIASVACYCDDCQAGARHIETLPHAPRVQEVDGGTTYLVYRKDRVQCSSGPELLKPHKIKPGSATNRVVAGCCNSAMFVNFDDGKHWVDVYRSRVRGDSPPVQMRICTKYKSTKFDLPADIRSYSGYPLRLLAKLLAARIAMLLRR